ncbi:MAG: OsmC family protein [Actinomycetota bacterium]|nr:OsmC family protein [Actinomycetota bacterium]
MPRTHAYDVSLTWVGNQGRGTTDYRSYSRDHELHAANKLAPLAGSSDPAFRGDGSRWNPEELLVASLSQCHMLWYLHLATSAGIVVTSYADDASGVMIEDVEGGGGQFSRVVLRPRVTVRDPTMAAEALSLHHDVGAMCFIARSVNFPVHHEPSVTVADDSERRLQR